MEWSSIIVLGAILLVFYFQLHFRLKKIEEKLIDLTMRIDSLEMDRTSASSAPSGPASRQ